MPSFLKLLSCFIFIAKGEGQHQLKEVALLPDVMQKLYQLWQHLSTVKGQVANRNMLEKRLAGRLMENADIFL